MANEQRRVAWVTGASRGVGRGIAVALGAAGWTVWVTARSCAENGLTSHLPGTVESVAAEVTAAGGVGLARACDHSDDNQVRAVVAEIEATGPLHLLVNNVWGGYERLNGGGWEEWNAPVWEQPLQLFDAMFTHGVRAHYVASALCAPLLIRSAPSAIVTVSMEAGAAHSADHGVGYSMAKAADDRLALALSGQLAAAQVASIALHPGLVRTEGVLQFAGFFDFSDSQSPEGVGRVVAAFAADTEAMSLTGQALTVPELAGRYGVAVA
jgi:NAD(P)-dependent dehydrogenase (short-subunit alcohol dehydrogenase family)